MKKMMKFVAGALMLFASSAMAFEYDVGMPEFRPQFRGARPGVWTLDYEGALSAAKADKACMIVLFTGSWWCPYCHTLDKRVLRTEAWLDYVAENGFYLAEIDFPYRGTVPNGQEVKSYHPEMGAGWGFKCWYMNPEYLVENGLTEEQGLRLIQEEYQLQNALARPDASQMTIRTWDGSSEFTYSRVGYPTILVYGPDGEELGRFSFPWSDTTQVTEAEAQEHVIQSIERLVRGKPELARVENRPTATKSIKYDAWLTDTAGRIRGLVNLTTSRASRDGQVYVAGQIEIDNHKHKFERSRIALGGAEEPLANVLLRLAGKLGTATVSIGEIGVAGTLEMAGRTYGIWGARNALSAKDAARLSMLPMGMWSVVLDPVDEEAPSPFARGLGVLTVDVKARGRATITGVMGDGTTVSKTTYLVSGDDGMSVLPVCLSLRGNKGSFGFLMYFHGDRFQQFDAVAPWICTDVKHPFVAEVNPRATIGCDSCSKIEEEMDLEIPGLTLGADIGGMLLADDYSADVVVIDGRKWNGQMTPFKSTFNPRTGINQGGMRLELLRPNGRIKRVNAVFRGVVMGGAGYGTLYLSNVGSWPVRIAACGSCGL